MLGSPTSKASVDHGLSLSIYIYIYIYIYMFSSTQTISHASYAHGVNKLTIENYELQRPPSGFSDSVNVHSIATGRKDR